MARLTCLPGVSSLYVPFNHCHRLQALRHSCRLCPTHPCECETACHGDNSLNGLWSMSVINQLFEPTYRSEPRLRLDMMTRCKVKPRIRLSALHTGFCMIEETRFHSHHVLELDPRTPPSPRVRLGGTLRDTRSVHSESVPEIQ